MSETQLPAVAKSLFTFCKKCDADRYHTVVAHTTATSAKLKCEVCGASSTYKLPKAQAKKTTGTGTAKKRASSPAARKSAHESEFKTFMESHSNADVAKYNMKAKFNVNQKLEHPKFGVGIIKTSMTDKIEVVFKDEVRSLVHNRA